MDVDWRASAAAAVFAASFFLLAAGRIGRRPVPRGAVALGGGLLSLALLDLAWAVVDLEVLLLLAGLMALAAMADASGLFLPLQAWIGRAPGKVALPAACALMAATSAVLLNDAAVVVLVPALLPVLRARVDAVAATVWLAVAANVGSLLTPFGNPQNAVLARAAGLGVADFLAQQAVVFVVAGACMAVPMLMLRGTPGDKAMAGPDARASAESPVGEVPGDEARADEAPGDKAPRDEAGGRPHSAWAVGAAAAFFVAWAIWQPERLGTGAALAAVAAFAWLRPLQGRALEARVARGVDLNVLALFVGLYLLTAGLGAWFPQRISPGDLRGPWDSAAAVLAVSNMVGNVPAILSLQSLDPAWVAGHAPFLVSVSTLGGSVLLTGSAATLLAAEAARRHGVEVSFLAFARQAGPWMAAATAFAAWWMW